MRGWSQGWWFRGSEFGPRSGSRSGPPLWGSLARARARVSARAAAHARGKAVLEALHASNTTQIVAYLWFIPLHWGVPRPPPLIRWSYGGLKRGEGLESGGVSIGIQDPGVPGIQDSGVFDPGYGPKPGFWDPLFWPLRASGIAQTRRKPSVRVYSHITSKPHTSFLDEFPDPRMTMSPIGRYHPRFWPKRGQKWPIFGKKPKIL